MGLSVVPKYEWIMEGEKAENDVAARTYSIAHLTKTG